MELLDIHSKLGDVVRTAYNLERVNRLAKEDPKTLVTVSEKVVDDQIDKVAKSIIKNKCKFVLLSGPSSSGKTTTTKIIAQKLQKAGVRAVKISLDDFFIDLDKAPKEADGTVDMESVNKLDIPVFNTFFENIMKHNCADMPEFDFNTDKRKKEWKKVEIADDDVILVEGTHALNPNLIKASEYGKRVLKVFICVNSEFYVGKDIVINARKLRLIRRTVRDLHTRGASVTETLNYWDAVCKGEDKFIGPYKNDADYIIDTTHIYEPLIYDRIVPGLLKQSMEAKYAKELAKIFGVSGSLGKEVVPDNSLLWEFIVKKEN